MLKRFSQLVLVVTVAFTMLGAGTPSTRVDRIGHKLMCTCSCAEILMECNHVGCPDSPGMIADLRSQVGAGVSDSVIFASFAAKYGPIVLASPVRGGFDNVAWIVPFALMVLGIVGVVLLLTLWQRRYSRLVSALPLPPPPTSTDAALRDRIRNETNYGE